MSPRRVQEGRFIRERCKRRSGAETRSTSTTRNSATRTIYASTRRRGSERYRPVGVQGALYVAAPGPIAARDAAWFEAVDRKTVPSLD